MTRGASREIGEEVWTLDTQVPMQTETTGRREGTEWGTRPTSSSGLDGVHSQLGPSPGSANTQPPRAGGRCHSRPLCP